MIDYENPWIYKGNPFSREQSAGYVGFVYLITHIDSGRKYIGKKIFTNRKAKPPLKGKTKRRISTVESNWCDYWGSGPAIKALVEEKGTASFKREILHLCYSKSEMGYLESKLIFATDAIISNDYLNDWVSARIQRNQLGKYISRLSTLDPVVDR